MIIYGLLTLPVIGQESRFYRVSSTQETMILNFDSAGLLTWTNSVSNASFQVEWTSNLVTTAWTQAPVHAVVANLDAMTTVLVSTISTNPPVDILQLSNVWANVNQSIESPPFIYRLTIYAWRDYQPVGPPSGLLVAARITETASGTIPSSLHITGISILHNGETWTPIVPPDELRFTSYFSITVRDGPAWDIGEVVEVRIIIQDDESKYLLKTTGVIHHVS